jgi:hypothetical protein
MYRRRSEVATCCGVNPYTASNSEKLFSPETSASRPIGRLPGSWGGGRAASGHPRAARELVVSDSRPGLTRRVE